jgi:hypothetical protein
MTSEENQKRLEKRVAYKCMQLIARNSKYEELAINLYKIIGKEFEINVSYIEAGETYE